ncbi:MAG TPA: WecB/TagA/CpsF family glycosyltransferase [Steroidobacteraceae bacterium]
MSIPGRVNVIGSWVNVCDMNTAIALVDARLQTGEGGYVCFTNAHTSVLGRRDPGFRAITNRSYLSVADGKPVYWLGRLKGRPIGHVPGPDFFLKAFERLPHRRHFLYGSTPRAIEFLQTRLRAIVPGAQVVGALSPPFRPLSPEDKAQHYATIRAASADFVWVGLGAPKQEQWMAEAAPHLSPCILFGVGAAFDFHAGTIPRAPPVMRALGLEWLSRLSQEPRRLWKRYLITNSLFVAYAFKDLLGGGSDPQSQQS